MPVFPSLIVQYNFEGQGWAERYYYKQDTTLNVVAQVAKALLLDRAALLGEGVKIVWAYVSFDDVFRDVLPVELPKINAEGKYPGQIANITPDQPNACLVLRMRSTDRMGKVLYLAGVADRMATFPTVRPPVIPADFQPLLGNFIVSLTGNWAWKGIGYDPGVSPITDVTAVTFSPDGTASFAVVNNAGFIPGKKCKLSKAKFEGDQSARGNRVFTISGTTGVDHVTAKSDADLSSLVYLGEGKLQVQNYVILPINEVTPSKWGTRKRGVGGNRYRGRAPKK